MSPACPVSRCQPSHEQFLKSASGRPLTMMMQQSAWESKSGASMMARTAKTRQQREGCSPADCRWLRRRPSALCSGGSRKQRQWLRVESSVSNSAAACQQQQAAGQDQRRGHSAQPIHVTWSQAGSSAVGLQWYRHIPAARSAACGSSSFLPQNIDGCVAVSSFLRCDDKQRLPFRVLASFHLTCCSQHSPEDKSR